MGRRKERRHAAMSAAGRRVKLDLFEEPSGDLGGSSAQNEVGGDDDDTKNQAGLPKSPSSSGKQLENPLVLLGQYSDDELDDQSNEEQSRAVGEDSLVVVDDEAKLADVQESENIGTKEENVFTAQKVEQLEMDNGPTLLESLQNLDESCRTENLAADSSDMREETSLTGQTSAVSEKQVAGDVILGWKVVLHEESNQYYYWNITTGETSWEIPDVLAQTVESKYGKRDATDTEELEKASDGSKDTNCKGKDLDEIKSNGNVEQNILKASSPHVGEHNVISESLELGHGGHNESGTTFSSSLLKLCERLLEQLNSIKGSTYNMEGQDHLPKYILEVEMRRTDIESLAFYSSSLLPFWVHTERRLQQLEGAINDVLKCVNPEQLNEVDAKHESCEKVRGDIGTDSSPKKTVYPALGDIGALESQVCNVAVTATELAPSEGHITTYSGNISAEKSEVDALATHCELTPQTVLHSGEEEDMDVDMEVEDAPATSNSSIADPLGVQCHIPSEKLNQSNLTAEDKPCATGEMLGVPLPPDEDWIPPPPPDNEPFPPPPPDNEPFPPPPPDEPPEILYPQPSDLVSVPSFPYAEQYSIPYTISNLEYYGQANTEVHGSNLYGNAEACLPTVSHPALYYEAPTYGPATLAVNPVQHVVYYGLQDGTLQPSIESSGFPSDSIHKNAIADAMVSSNAHAEVDSTSLPKSNIPVIAKGAVLEIPPSQSSDSATISVTESTSVSSVPSSAASVTASVTAPKAQSKVSRNKKRTVAAVSSLRSNKKVSSMVDKWKAAKEELEEEEEEPKTAYEILEKKRQREIEEWKAQQIASGEAKDNANFQPLGGDWRERVKRKRAQLAKESVRTPSDGVTEGNQQPDLDELSKGLPHGWQAYWDDSSKQVYYGNSMTSETTWTRPTSKGA